MSGNTLDPNGNVHNVESDSEFRSLLQSAGNSLIVVDFYADWCGPCKHIAPHFVNLSVEYPTTVFLKVNVDKLQQTSQSNGVSAMPTFMFFRNGVKIREMKGANPQLLTQTLQECIQSAPSSVSSPPQSNQQQPPQAPSTKFEWFPLKSYVFFEDGKPEMMVEKLIKNNAKYLEDEAKKGLALSNSEILLLQKTSSTVKNSTQYHITKVTQEELIVFDKVLKWSPEDRFPILDLLRMLVLHLEAGELYSKIGLNNFLRILEESNLPFTNYLMILRLICNSFRFESLRNSTMTHFAFILGGLEKLKNQENNQLRIALNTVLLNTSFYLSKEKNQEERRKNLIPLLFQNLSVDKEEESQLRAIVALGTLLLSQKELITEILKQPTYLQALGGMKPASQKVSVALNELQLIFSGKVPSTAGPSVGNQANAQPSIPPSNTNNMFGMGGMEGFGGMGNFGGMGMGQGGMPQIPPEMLNRLMSNPRLMAALQNPSVMEKLQRVMADPSRMMEFQNDPEIMELIAMFSGM
eukprot:TRINITY_DN3515_c0_g1_i1.p1 TRINITY_DN3515_c0_g1~~TRINITY_DN3515_c0_g1_i1.p1  ORF type:complete len:523 (-),score=211.35 TRINITY_DN3515_c0_g1_i1:36-1604(-)